MGHAVFSWEGTTARITLSRSPKRSVLEVDLRSRVRDIGGVAVCNEGACAMSSQMVKCPKCGGAAFFLGWSIRCPACGEQTARGKSPTPLAATKPVTSQWFCSKDDSVDGPFDEQTLHRKLALGEMTPDTRVASAGHTGNAWRTVRDVPELLDAYVRGKRYRQALAEPMTGKNQVVSQPAQLISQPAPTTRLEPPPAVVPAEIVPHAREFAVPDGSNRRSELRTED